MKYFVALLITRVIIPGIVIISAGVVIVVMNR